MDIEDQAPITRKDLEMLYGRAKELGIPESKQIEIMKNIGYIDINLKSYKQAMRINAMGGSEDVKQPQLQLNSSIIIARRLLSELQPPEIHSEKEPEPTSGVYLETASRTSSKPVVPPRTNTKPEENPDIKHSNEVIKSNFGEKIEKIVRGKQFEEWILFFIGENELPKLKEMLNYLSGDLGERKIISGYSYWGIVPTNVWRGACNDDTYIMKESISNFPRIWKKILPKISDAGIQYDYVSLGVGDGQKDSSILSDLIARNRDMMYFPIDMSPEMLKSGIKDVLSKVHDLERTQILPIQVDFSNQDKLGEIRGILDTLIDKHGRIIFGLLGNTLANFDNDYELLHNLSNILKSGDLLLLELATTESISTESKGFAKREYNSNSFKNFAISSLNQATNIEIEPGWIDIEVEEEKIAYKEIIKALKILIWYKNKEKDMKMHFSLDNEAYDFHKGDKIRLYMSRKYTVEGIKSLINELNLETVLTHSENNPKKGNLGCELLLLRKQ